jgi:hypothetical protein
MESELHYGGMASAVVQAATLIKLLKNSVRHMSKDELPMDATLATLC